MSMSKLIFESTCTMGPPEKKVEYLVADTTAFLQNAQLQDVAEKVVTAQEVVDEILNKRQLRRLVVLPYELEIKTVFPENVQVVTAMANKTGDYGSLSATDIKVMALTYQLEKEHVGVQHIRTEPLIQRTTSGQPVPDMQADVTGFFVPGKKQGAQSDNGESDDNETGSGDEDDDDSGWITPANVALAKKQVHSDLIAEEHMTVACMTTDFAMQNVLKQMNLNVAALDGRTIKQLRTFILRCYTCFKTTSVMTKQFCPNCGHNTLKKVAVSLDADGKMKIHINAKRPLTGRGKKFSLPKMKGGKHPNNPVLVADHPMPQNQLSKLAKTKLNPLDDDYIAGFSPFVMRDVTSRSAQLGIKSHDVKHWMRRNPNEARRKRK